MPTSDMKAIRLDEVGPPENLKLVDVPVPEIGDEDLLIRVDLAGLLYADTEQRRGTYYLETALPHFPGREVAGTIEQVGSRVTGYESGQRIVALMYTGGGYAEYVRAQTRPYEISNGVGVPSADIHLLPDNVSFDQALVYITNFRLAYLLHHIYIDIPPEATVLIHGAAGGFGSVSTQIAIQNNNRVIAVCRTAAQVEFCKSMGAEHIVDVDADDYVEAALDMTGGEGVDYSINGVGGVTLDRDPLALKTFGEIIAYGYAAGKSKPDIFTWRKCLTVKNFIPNNFMGTEVMDSVNEAMQTWFASMPLLEVTKTFPLENAAAAHQWLEEGRAIGKIALKP